MNDHRSFDDRTLISTIYCGTVVTPPLELSLPHGLARLKIFRPGRNAMRSKAYAPARLTAQTHRSSCYWNRHVKIDQSRPTTESPTSFGSGKNISAIGFVGKTNRGSRQLFCRCSLRLREEKRYSSTASALYSTQRGPLGGRNLPAISERTSMLSRGWLLHACNKRHVFRMGRCVPSNNFQLRNASNSCRTFVNQHGRKETYHTYNFIGNELVASKCTEWIDLHDPATGQIVSKVPQSTDAELLQAVDSAQDAFPSWRDTSILKRQQIMFRFTALIRENWDRLAEAITTEQGKTLADAHGDVLRGLQVAETACGATTQMIGEVLEVAKDMETKSYREPLGVVAAICPFSERPRPSL